MASRNVFVLDQFRGGHTENGFSSDVARWQGKNVVVSKDGLLMPRPGIKKYDSGNFDAAATGRVLAIGYNPDVRGVRDGWIAVQPLSGGIPASPSGNVRVYTLMTSEEDSVFLPPLFVGELDVGCLNGLDSVNWLGDSYVAVPDSGVWKLDLDNSALTKLSASPESGGYSLTAKNGNFILGGVRGAGADDPRNRIYWSNFNDPTSWDLVENFIEIPTVNTLTSFLQVRDTLHVGTGAGELFIISGSTPEQWVVRPLLFSGGPAHHQSAGIVANEVIFKPWTSVGRETPSIYACCTPRPANDLDTTFRGQWDRVGADGVWENPQAGIVALEHTGDFAAIDGTQAVITYRQDGSWSRHDIEGLDTPLAGGRSVAVSSTTGFDFDRVLFAEYGKAGEVPELWTWKPRLDRPAFVSDPYSSPGDDSVSPLDASVLFAEMADPQGRDLRVQEIIVDFVSWDTGSPVGNSLTVRAEITQIEGVSGSEFQTLDWTEPGAPSLTGSRRCIAFPVRLGTGPIFRVGLENIKGVGVQRLTVIFDGDALPARGV